MAWTTPRTYVAGEILTAATLNTDHRDNLNILKASMVDDGGLVDDASVGITIASNTIVLNLAAGRTFSWQATANITTTTLQNVPAAGKNAWFMVRIHGDGSARTWTWFDSTVVWGSAIVPTRTPTNNVFDWFLFMSLNGGTTWNGFVLDQGFP